jgi:uncharacterized protein
MPRKFLDAVRQGDNHWTIYLRVFLAIGFYWVALSGYTVLICYASLSLILGLTHTSLFIANAIPFIVLLAILVFSVEKLHRRNVHSLINANAAINSKRLSLGFGIWGGLSLSFSLLDMLSSSENYFFTPDLRQWLILLPFILILTPIQTSVEELLFRGYLLQGLSLISRHRFTLIMISSLAFAVPHFANPEMERGLFIWGALNYLTWGIFLAAITLKDNGLELALGIHAANNIFSFLLINTPDSVLPTPALFTYTGSIDARESFLSVLIQAGIFYAIVFGGIGRNKNKDCPSS